ncbi:conserved hypothetical protein [Candidatus Brocadia pituitae]|nr:conserved hypothetical protein [Candidatus Brocadia pituitae]
MKRILVSLVSEHTIPNILIAAHYKPDDFWFVSTDKMERERKVECIVNTLKLKELLPASGNIQKVIVDQDSPSDCMGKIESLIEKVDGEVEYVVNITGGNKLMALATYEVFRETGQRVIIDYIPLGKNELVQIFPRKKPLRTCKIKERLNLEEYLSSYGFGIQNKNSLEKVKTNALSRKESSQWILDNYEQLKDMLGFLYKNLKDVRNKKEYQLSATFDRDPANSELEILEKHGFEIKDRLISKDMKKDEIVYLTGGWFEEFVFNEIYTLVQEGTLDDARIGVQIESHSRTSNDLDIAFMKDNSFYYVECKTLGNEEDQSIIRDEIYKKGAISALLGKGEKRAMICTTQSQINESLTKRARDYSIGILSIEQVRNFKNRLRERFEIQK